MAMKPKAQPKGKYPGPGYDEAAAAREMMAFFKLQQSRQYSPAPMSAAAKKKAAAAGKATAAKTKSRGPKAGTAAASKIVKNLKSRAREVRDVPTSFANAISMWEANMGPNTKAGPQSGRMLKDIAKQSGEAARALLTGKKGTAPLKVTKNPKDKFYGAMTNREYIAKQAKPDNSRDVMKKMMGKSGKALTPAQKAKLKNMTSGRLNK
jgi:hypothetical protein